MKEIIIFCCVIVAFAGCKKSGLSAIKRPQDTVAAKKDTLLVSAVIGELGTSRFQYDGDKRLISETDSGTFDLGNMTMLSSFEYDADGNLIKRHVSTSFADTVYNITYVNGQPVSATYDASRPGVAGSDVTGTITYTVTNNKVTEIDCSGYTPNLQIKLSYSGNNIASIKANGTFADSLVNYNYGTKQSPFASSRFKWFLFPDWLPLTEGNFYRFAYPVNMFNENDVESFSTSRDPNSSSTFTNSYNISGYPTQVVGSSQLHPNQTIVYQYTK